MTSWQNVATPMVLLLTGLVLLMGDGLGILSLDRIQKFWPLAIVVVAAMESPLKPDIGMKKERS